jgi:CheY-like chemotaxis protein
VRKGLGLTVTLDPAAPPVVRLDGMRLRQILNNLLSNALKFTQRGEVSLRIRAEGSRLCCTVTDTGIGISPEEQARLFQRFVQADDARARRHQGSGLGLALSRELASLMGGSLELTSTPGQGSSFTCLLPLVATTELAPAPVSAPSQLPRGLHVLVVDDNAVNRLVAQRLLDRSGCVVEVAPDGLTAMDALARGHFDVVLMDVHMPELDGLEVTRRIRQGENGRRLPIIGVSASAAGDDVESCRLAGMDDFLAKPVTRDRLIETILRCV